MSDAIGGVPRVRILDEDWDPRELDDGASFADRASVVCLFYLDPMLRSRLERRLPCHGLESVVGSEAEWGAGAHRLAERFVAAGPRHAGEPWRAYLWEALYRELHRYRLLLGLAELGDRLAEGKDLVFEGALNAADRALFEAILEDRPRLSYQALAAEGPKDAAAPAGRLRRLLARLREGWLTGSLSSELVDLAEGFDPGFAHRCRWGPRLCRARNVPQGAVVLLSAYANNSRTLSVHRRTLSEATDAPVHWLTITASARRGIPRGDDGPTDGSWLWSYGSSPEPRPEDGAMATHDGEGAPPGWGSWRSTSPTVASWLESQQDLARRLTSCFEAFLERARPRMLVVANQFSIEGWLARLAQRRGIPVVQVMHGVLGGHLYTRTPIVGDLLVTFGDFWRDLWPVEEQQKIVVVASDSPEPRRRRVVGRRRLTFFSWDLAPLWGYGAREVRASLTEIFRRLLTRDGIEIRVRCHPLENPASFLDDWRRRFGPVPAGLEVEKGGSLETLLDQTDVALMFRSTLMLSCLGRGIPIVLPGWIDFEFNGALGELPGVHLARDPDDLEECLERWLDDPPEIPRAAVAPLVAEPGTGHGVLAGRLRELGGEAR